MVDYNCLKGVIRLALDIRYIYKRFICKSAKTVFCLEDVGIDVILVQLY